MKTVTLFSFSHIFSPKDFCAENKLNSHVGMWEKICARPKMTRSESTFLGREGLVVLLNGLLRIFLVIYGLMVLSNVCILSNAGSIGTAWPSG